MARIVALSFAFVAFVVPALGASPVDTAAVTCKEYNASSHQGMVDVGAAFYEALKGKPKFAALSENQLGDTIDKVCAANPNVKIIEALGVGG